MVESRRERLTRICSNLEKDAREALRTCYIGFKGNQLVSVKTELSELDVSDSVLRAEERLKNIAYDAKRNGDFDTAIRAALDMKRLNQNRNSKADKILTEIYIAMGDFENAKKSLANVFGFCKYDPKAYVQYAEILYKTGNYQDAIRAVNMSFIFEGNNRNAYSNSLLVCSYIRGGYDNLFEKRMKSLNKKYELGEFIKFYKCCISNLTKEELVNSFPMAQEFIEYDFYTKKGEEILDELGHKEFDSYISNLEVTPSFKALIMLNAAKLCEERKLGNLSYSYVSIAKELDDGTINIKKFVSDTEKTLKFLRNSKRGVK